jgi:hypothetical protein
MEFHIYTLEDNCTENRIRNNTMDSITVGCEKQSPGKIQFSSNSQRFRQYSARITNNQERIPNKKKVVFNLGVQPEAFENTEIELSGAVRSQRSLFDDDDYMLPALSSTNMFTSE